MISGGRGTLLRMALLALCWGSSFVWIKLALGSFSPVQIAAGRIVLGALLLVGWCLVVRARMPRTARMWGHLAVAAFFGTVLPFVLFGLGERTVDSGVAGVLNATVPLWALLIGILVGTDWARSPVRVVGLLLGFAGTLLIFAPWQAGGLLGVGTLEILGAAVSYAVSYAYIARHLTGRGVGPVALSASQLVAAIGLNTVVVPVAGLRTGPVEPVAVVAVVFLGVFGTGLAYVLNYRLIADEGATGASVVGYLLPVVSVLLGALVLHEPLTLRVLAGMLVVLTGVALTRIHRRTPTPAEAGDHLSGAATRAGRG